MPGPSTPARRDRGPWVSRRARGTMVVVQEVIYMGWLIIVAFVVIWLVVAHFDSRVPGHNIKWPWLR